MRSWWRGNPYFVFGPRPIREAHLRAYIVRQHRAGRALVDIVQDPYVKRCGNESFCWRVLQQPDTLAALHANDVAAFERVSAELDHHRHHKAAEG